VIQLLAEILVVGDASTMRVLNYITVRAGLALALAFVLAVLLGPRLIAYLQKLQAIQAIRNDIGADAISLQEMHKKKIGVPTMGGLLMLVTILISTLLFTDLKSPVVWLAMLCTVGFCGLGFLDDYLKVVKKNSDGLSPWAKITGQVFLGGIFAAVYSYVGPAIVSYNSGADAAGITGPQFLLFPFFKDLLLNLGIFYMPFAILVLTATSNAVNLTDGLDGLAAGVTISAALCFAIMAYLIGRADSSSYLIIPHVRGAGELTVILAALTGACLGFLWFNAHPAQMFMGDTGSMMLGGLLGSVALLIKQEALLLIVGGVFVMEALSVMIQVTSYKLRKKRVFRMAPLHHHFERGGLPESKIIARFWIVSALLAMAGLMTLKLR